MDIKSFHRTIQFGIFLTKSVLHFCIFRSPVYCMNIFISETVSCLCFYKLSSSHLLTWFKWIITCFRWKSTCLNDPEARAKWEWWRRRSRLRLEEVLHLPPGPAPFLLGKRLINSTRGKLITSGILKTTLSPNILYCCIQITSKISLKLMYLENF